ncbi:hypothetical protein B0H10DRAFT_1977691 [Mycena sp. CBHHK59/15]|nr:hypothetical protein B0H10DRAFT_1977691 [Mycena sp. CBHHK59/15]
METQSTRPVFHLLPHDVLHDLFVLCVNTSEAHSNMPIVLSHVCHSWRHTALASPMLWTIIIFKASRPSQKHLQAHASLQRSRGLPISLHINVIHHLQRHEGDIVGHNAERLCRLSLTSSDREIGLSSMEYLGGIAMPLLESFDALVADEINLTVTRKPNPATPFYVPPFTPHRLTAPVSRTFFWSPWKAQNLTSLCLKGLGPGETPSVRLMWQILSGCKLTLVDFHFEGSAPSGINGRLEVVLVPVVLPALRTLRIGYLDNFLGLLSCIYAPNLRALCLHDALFFPTIRLPPARSTVTQPNLALVFELLSPSCTHLLELRLVGMDACPRATVDTFFGTLSRTTFLAISSCHAVYTDALFQPEARFRVPKVVFPRLHHLDVSLTDPVDLSRFLLRHKTVTVPALKQLYIPQRMASLSTGGTGIFSIVLDLCLTHFGTSLTVLRDPPVHLIRRQFFN